MFDACYNTRKPRPAHYRKKKEKKNKTRLEMDARWDELSVGVKLSLKMELATTNLSKIAHLEFKKKNTLIC